MSTLPQHRKINAADLHYLPASETHPADTYFHFSFADYFDPDNMNFGVLRVINDDFVKPQSGFTTHPHRNMGIFSYIVAGQLTHRDSAGNHEILGRGEAQCISAGTGVTHSELNERDDWCRFLQIWVLPEAANLPVRYDLHKYTFEDRHHKLSQIISGSKQRAGAPLYLCQDVNAYVCELTDKGVTVLLTVAAARQAYIYCFEGSVNTGQFPTLAERDSLKVYGQADLEFTLASETAHFIVIEVPRQ